VTRVARNVLVCADAVETNCAAVWLRDRGGPRAERRAAAMTIRSAPARSAWPRFLRNNGLSLAVTAMFLLTMAGQTVTGWMEHNDDLRDHERPTLTFAQYFRSGHFIEATAENWESEFLQMTVFVLLTVFLYQKGSSESKQIDKPEAVDRDPRRSERKPGTPWPVLRGGWILRVYENSLSLALFVLFSIAFALHAAGGSVRYNESQLEHGGATVSVWGYLATSQFWFESLQNWQSEFLSLAAMIVLSIYLRQRGSPESKPVDAPHDQTGED
jgi:hypothetical protein